MESLKRKIDFQNLRDRGNTQKTAPWLLVNFSKNDLGLLRVGFTVSAKIGGAVLRNRLKRWGREFLKRQDPLSVDVNFVFLNARSASGRANIYKELKHEEFDRVLGKTWKIIRQKIERRIE